MIMYKCLLQAEQVEVVCKYSFTLEACVKRCVEGCPKKEVWAVAQIGVREWGKNQLGKNEASLSDKRSSYNWFSNSCAPLKWRLVRGWK
jgi:hypothetical protein